MSPALSALRTQGIPLTIAALFALALNLPDQSLEMLRYSAQATAEYARGYKEWENLHDLVAIFLSLVLLSMALFLASSALAVNFDVRGERHLTVYDRAFCLLVGLAPVLSAAFALQRARIRLDSQELEATLKAGSTFSYGREYDNAKLIENLANAEVASHLQINNWLLTLAGASCVLAVILAIVFALVLRRERFLKRISRYRPRTWAGFTLFVVLVTSLFFAFYPMGPAKILTPFGVICLFFLIATWIMSMMSLLAFRTGLPLFVLTVGVALVFGLLEWNDNHRIRAVLSPGGDNKALQTVAEGFEAWWKARKDKDRYEVYPVYVVAAEGGGIYAAFRTATFLSSLQDLCPRFGDHLFAISSVSGGSIGGAVFAGLTRQIKEDESRFLPGKGCRNLAEHAGELFLTDISEDIFREDYLSPVLGSFLFPDLLQRFLPFPVGFFDRARALEFSLETSWEKWVNKYRKNYPERWLGEINPLSEPYSSHWRPDGKSPALFINTTEVATGRGRVIAPFVFASEQSSGFPLRDAKNPNVEPPLSTAAVLSARYPWLTPAGWFNIERLSPRTGEIAEKKIFLVDGGYYDNSGVITAEAIIGEIERAAPRLGPKVKIKVNLIVLTATDFSEPTTIGGDYLLPFEALLNTRSARGKIAIERAERVLSAPSRKDEIAKSFAKAELIGYGYPLPLGWRLSPLTRLLILGENGDHRACGTGPAQTLAKSTNCLKADVFKEMSR